MKIVCVGDCGIDSYVDSDDRRVGGITTNFALQARACFGAGDSIQIIAPLGSDSAARLVRKRFVGSDIDCHFTAMPGSTPVQYIAVDSSGERQFVRYDEGVLGTFRIETKDARRIGNAGLVMAPVFEQNQPMFASLLAVKTRGIMAVDFADFGEHADFPLLLRYIEKIDIGFFALSMDQAETIESLRLMSVQHKLLIVVTLGASGSRAFLGNDVYDCAAAPVPRVVDTTGAGDAFAAGFLSRYCHTSDITESLSVGSKTAAVCIQKRGGN